MISGYSQRVLALETSIVSDRVDSRLRGNDEYKHQRMLRIPISGRNAPVFSFENQDSFSDIQETGNQVLRIWNSRIEEATQQYSQLRTIVLIRDMDSFQFKIFEQPTNQFDPADYTWRLNPRNNFEGHSIQGAVHTFTWQPHGSQFTIIRQVSGSARSFQIRKPDVLKSEEILKSLGYSEAWVEFL